MKILIVLACCLASVSFGDFVLVEEFEAQWDGAPTGLDCDDANGQLMEISQQTAIVYVDYGTWEWTHNYYFPSSINLPQFCVLGNSISTYDMYLSTFFGSFWVRDVDEWSQRYPPTYEVTAIDLAPDGTLWAASCLWGVYHLSSDCETVIDQWMIPEMTEDPNGIAHFQYGGNDYLVITSKDDHQLYVYTTTGQFVGAYASPISGDYHTYDLAYSETYHWFFWSYIRYNGDGFIAKMTFDGLSLEPMTWGSIKRIL